jgi:dUTP pyrophosphatase
VILPVHRVNPEAQLPARAHPGDAGLDLCATEGAVLAPSQRAPVPTGIAVAIPEGYAGLMLPRSGLALHHGVTMVNAPGLIDAGYRGELVVTLVNLSDRDYAVDKGDRIGQLVIIPMILADVVETDVLPPSDGRGTEGFGSTGA